MTVPSLPGSARAIQSSNIGKPQRIRNMSHAENHHDYADESRDFEKENCNEIHLTDQTGVIVWKDSNGQLQHAPNLYVDLHLAISQNEAFFKLHGRVFLKGAKPNNFSLYLFIHPENIQSVTYSHGAYPTPPVQRITGMSLRFRLKQPPRFIVPADRPLEAKGKSKHLLDAMIALASAKDFTIYPVMSNLLFQNRDQLSVLSLLSFNDLKTDTKRADTQTLYHGAGSRSISGGDITTMPSRPPILGPKRSQENRYHISKSSRHFDPQTKFPASRLSSKESKRWSDSLLLAHHQAR
ncbi:hypothetical protein QBC43DRAFT_328282 [Cladorrhinum sp. PSN259]|nr:hypothetical protein QBC43DRAFT_328282 [Cladorrhinum sp. PSN259]